MKLKELVALIPAGQIIKVRKQYTDIFYEDRQLFFTSNYLNEKDVVKVISGFDNEEDIIIIEVK